MIAVCVPYPGCRVFMIKSHVLFTEAVVLLFASQSRWIGFEPMTFASLLRIAVKIPSRICFQRDALPTELPPARRSEWNCTIDLPRIRRMFC